MPAKKGQRKKQEDLHKQTSREVGGVCFIALALFFAASVYSDAVGMVGKFISTTFFGLLGPVGYALPFILFIYGIAAIVTSRQGLPKSVIWLCALGVVCAATVMHIYTYSDLADQKLLEFYKDAYVNAVAKKLGGGVLGALLAYPSLLLLGKAGSYIFFITGIVVILLLVTRLSLRDTGEKVGRTIASGVDIALERLEERRSTLYTEDLSSEESRVKKLPKRKAKIKPPMHTRALAEDIQSAPIGELHKVKYAQQELDFLPMSGTIDRKRMSIEERFDDVMSEFTPQGDEVLPAEEGRISRISENIRDKAEPTKPAVRPIKPVPVVQPESTPEVADLVETFTAKADVLEYQRPPLTLLNLPESGNKTRSTESPQEKAKVLIDTLASFGISVRLLDISVGPVITRFELQPAQGVRLSRITTLSNDLALALAAPRVRIEAPIPGKAAIGIEVPNKETTSVLLREIIESPEFQAQRSPIAFALGRDIAGKIIHADLDRMPHLLIAGSTGSGKSVCINTIIISMIYRASPEQVRMILIDPKVVELKVFSSLPHLLLPVVTEPKKAASALRWAVMEMEQRYQKMSMLNARDMARYNALQEDPEERMPKLVIVIDELADLMMVASKDVEESICRIAQLGRACGIHLIVATQRPSSDIITGLIKANIASRIAFMVSSGVDSRVILDENGAEKLLGKGDMLFHPNGASKFIRAQGAFISDEEVERVMEFFAEHDNVPQFGETILEDITLAVTTAASEAAASEQATSRYEDELLPDAVKVVFESGQASISMIQRRLRVGYARAARLIDIMEQRGIVSGFDGSKPRRLLIDAVQYEQLFGSSKQEG